MQTKKYSFVLILVSLQLFVVLFVFFMYTFLHEAGHAIVGLLFGQTLTAFDVSFLDLSAHVGMVGGELTDSQLAIQSLAGVSLPFLIWAIFIGLIPRKTSFTLESVKLISSMAVINTLLPWMILPLLFLFGKAPSDDVTNFLGYSEMPPLLLAFIASILYAGGWILFLSKVEGFRKEFLLFTISDPEKITSGTRKTIPALAGLMTACVIVTIMLNARAETSSMDMFLPMFLPPQDFSPVAQVDLSRQAYSSEILGEFTLDRAAYVGVFTAIRNIDTTYFDLSMTGPDGFSSIVLHGEGYNAVQDGGLWKMNLPAGTYQIVLTSHQSQGTTSVYMKIY
jgi:hypothetical protein